MDQFSGHTFEPMLKIVNCKFSNEKSVSVLSELPSLIETLCKYPSPSQTCFYMVMSTSHRRVERAYKRN